MAVALVHEQNIIHFIFNVERMQRDGLIQGERVVGHIGVGQGFLCSQAIHWVKGQDLFQKIQGCREKKDDKIKSGIDMMHVTCDCFSVGSLISLNSHETLTLWTDVRQQLGQRRVRF